ncbi:MAG: hypothetical protein HY337_02060 [Gemmatimonadetes bacterium]|nr:hypothetical protein [Gemmatimonadota bacterium]
MKRTVSLGLLVVAACTARSRENSASCGFASIAAASMIINSLENMNMVVADMPADVPGVLPARVVGHGTARVVVAPGPEGLVMGYEGEGFPTMPGFGLLLVDDSSEAVRGVMIYEPEGPGGYPKLGTVSGAAGTIPLYGLRVHWPSLNAPKCPLFAAPPTDSAAA